MGRNKRMSNAPPFPSSFHVILETDFRTETTYWPNFGKASWSFGTFSLRFSAPMDRVSVENNLIIRSFDSNTFSVDQGITMTDGSDALSLSNPTVGTAIWDREAFHISWDPNHTLAHFSFKDERYFPLDKAFKQSYYVSFTRGNGILRDAAGAICQGNYFKGPDGKESGAAHFLPGIAAFPLLLIMMKVHTQKNGHPEGDSIRIQFSERLIHFTLDKIIAGGMNGNAAQAPAAIGDVSAEAAAANYQVMIQRSGRIIASNTWANLGGIAVYDPTDLTHATVCLLSSRTLFQPGDQITVEVARSIVDPAGNQIYGYGNKAMISAIAR